MKAILTLLLLTISLPCLASNYEVYYPSTVKIISTGFANATYTANSRVTLDGLDSNKRVLYTGHLSGRRAPDKIYSFTFIPSKNIKGKIVVREILDN